MPSQPSFTCPDCKAVSFNPNDIRNGYCGRCHSFTRQEALEPAEDSELLRLLVAVEDARAERRRGKVEISR